ncbi:cytochrome P450 [Phlegmacium glaucopus]|nr:cytochrome P450 [Phlegmacium glaucopus]
MQGIALLLLTFAVLYLGRRLLSFVKALQAIQYHPGKRTLISATTFLGNTLPKIPGVSLGRHYLFVEKHKFFESAGWDICALISILPNSGTTLLLADAAAVKEVISSRARFPKPVEHYTALSFYGPNIVVSEGEEWKKYRKISAPAFSDRNNKLVWEETVKIMQSLFNDLWKDQDIISVDHCLDITLPIALFVIGSAGFGRSVSWKEEDTIIPPGHTMSYKEALHVVTTDFIIKLLAPSWALGLTARLQKVKLAFEELHTYVAEMIRERESAVEKTERHDLFSSLLQANDDDFGLPTLSENELIANIYIFLVAGHETTAHTLCFAFALLALYPDEQEKLFEHINSVTNGRLPTYAEMPLLTRSTAVINETLRMFPPVLGIPKVSAEDTGLMTSNIHGERTTVPVPKGTRIIIDTPGIHYNPRYWKDPHTFNPSRFLTDWPRDAFLPFSSGARACIGRKFAETEGIAALTMLVSQFKITIKEEPQFAAETFEQRKARLLSARAGLTLTPVRVPLVFTRRS